MDIDVRKELEIHDYHILGDVQNQPLIFRKVSKLYAKAKSAYKHAVLRLRLLKADLRMDIRNNPTAYGILGKKPSASAIDDMVDTNPEVRALEEELLTLEEAQDTHYYLVEAFRQRKDMISDGVRLLLSDMYSRRLNKIPDDAAASTKEAVKRILRKKE